MKIPCKIPDCPYGIRSSSNKTGLCNKCLKARNAKRRYVKKTLLKISEKDLELLQRYDLEWEYMKESEDGIYVEWDALIKLLK